MRQPSTVLPTSHANPRDHIVEFYDDPAALGMSVAGFMVPVLDGGVGVIIVDADHTTTITAAMTAAGFDVDAAIAQGRLILRDAATMLAQLVGEGPPDAAAFHDAVDDLITSAAGRSMHVYGEMVALLWEQGQRTAALRLETLWNDVLATRNLSLMCGYPSRLFPGPDGSQDLDDVCTSHSDAVLAPSQLMTVTHVRWVLPAALTSGARARRRLRPLLTTWGFDEVLAAAELLMTELINNAVVHAGTDMVVDIGRDGSDLRIEVIDRGEGTPRPQDTDPEDTSGRGLMLVETLSSSWGAETTVEGKRVWFQLSAAEG